MSRTQTCTYIRTSTQMESYYSSKSTQKHPRVPQTTHFCVHLVNHLRTSGFIWVTVLHFGVFCFHFGKYFSTLCIMGFIWVTSIFFFFLVLLFYLGKYFTLMGTFRLILVNMRANLRTFVFFWGTISAGLGTFKLIWVQLQHFWVRWSSFG